MHFGFALELSDIDLWNIDLLDTHLDLLDTDIASENFVCLHSIFKTSSRYAFKTSSIHVFKTSSRRLQRNNFSSSNTSSRSLGRCKIVALKTCWRRLQDVFKTNRCLLGRPRTRDMWEGFWYYISHCLDFFCRNGFCRIEIFMKKIFFKVTIVISFDSTDLRKDSTLAK